MRSIKTVALVAATLLLIPQIAAAADLDTQVQDMKQRLEQMEDQLQAQNQELAAAQEDRSVTSALSSFFEKTDVSGFVAAGWNWGKGEIELSDNNSVELFDDNTFQLDQAWVEMTKTPTEESRAGFNLAFEMGEFATQAGDSDTPGIYAASVSYLAPLGDGLTITAGIMPTALGAEVENQNGNWQISRGLVWDLQPVTNTGITARYSITDQLSVMVGALNAPITGERTDSNDAKGLTSQISFAAEKFSVAAGVNWGSQADNLGGCGSDNYIGGFNCQSEGILDVVLTVTPMEKLSFWVNYDFYWAEAAGNVAADKLDINGIAVAGRFGITDNTGFSARYEYVEIGGTNKDGSDLFTDNINEWEITMTVDHQITDGLLGKVEYRHERLGTRHNDYPEESANSIYVQMMYEF
ncbi:MAG: outer membrane beta-barrel protein [Myxococcota bacterium]